MYLNEILNDTFFLVLVIVISIVFVFIGWRNYTDPKSRLPVSPLGRYLLSLAIEKNHIEETDPRKEVITERFVRIDALFALITGSAVILVMGVVLAFGILS